MGFSLHLKSVANADIFAYSIAIYFIIEILLTKTTFLTHFSPNVSYLTHTQGAANNIAITPYHLNNSRLKNLIVRHR